MLPKIADSIHSFISENPEVIAIALTLIWEAWLGKTKKVRSNSSVELLGVLIKLIFRRRKP